MKKLQIENKLSDMIGKTYMYRQNNMKIESFAVGEIETIIHTDWRDITFSNHNAKVKFEELLPVADEPGTDIVRHVEEEMGVIRVEMPELMISKKAKQISDIILKNIEMIQESPDNIPKAAAINDQVKTFMDICKTEVEAMKVAAYVHKVHN